MWTIMVYFIIIHWSDPHYAITLPTPIGVILLKTNVVSEKMQDNLSLFAGISDFNDYFSR